MDSRTPLVESVTHSEDAALLTATEDRLVQQDATVISHRRTVSKSYIFGHMTIARRCRHPHQ